MFKAPATRLEKFLSPIVLLMTFAAMTPVAVHAAGLTIGADDTVSLGSGTVNLGCGDLVVNGTLNLDSGTYNNVDNVIIGSGGVINGGSGNINLSGDWTNNGGTTNPGTSSVVINTDCGSDTVNITGSSTFNKFTMQTSNGRQLNFGAGDTNTFNGHLILNGAGDKNAPANLLKIRSTAPGTPANIFVGSTYVINKVDVRDNHAKSPGRWVDFGYPEEFDSIDGGGNARWFRNSATNPGSVYFNVTKTFDDGNTGNVKVFISCNKGQILDQEKLISSSRDVTFVITSIDARLDGADCRIWEEDETGYTAKYALPAEPDGCSDFTEKCSVVNSGSAQGCFFEDVHTGEGEELNTCNITNELQPVEFTVTKQWLYEGQPNLDVKPEAKIDLNCGATAPGSESSWSFTLNGNDSVTQDVYPRWQGNTVCTVTEDLPLDGIESSGCEEQYPLKPGDAPVGCTVTNTVFYEGIPTLSEWGMALMALLMLGVGMISFRRFA